MSRTRQQMNITEETMELSLIEIGYGEHSVQETYFTALLLKLDQKKLHEWKINRKSIIPLLRPCYTKRRIPVCTAFCVGDFRLIIYQTTVQQFTMNTLTMSEFEYYIFLYNIISIQHVYIIQIHFNTKRTY